MSIKSGITILTSGSTYNGTTSMIDGVLRDGAVETLSANSNYNVDSAGTLDLDGFSKMLGDITNAGIIDLAGNNAGAILIVNGNYAGEDGIIHFDTELGNDRATFGRLVVTGDVTGKTNVRVNNPGCHGAETLNGIELIEVQGNAGSSAFKQDGRIVAGAYDYRLVRGDRNWYLSSRINLESGRPIIDNGGGGENPGGGEGVMVLRPEGGAYAANLATAARLFDTCMSDRQGTYYLDLLRAKRSTPRCGCARRGTIIA